MTAEEIDAMVKVGQRDLAQVGAASAQIAHRIACDVDEAISARRYDTVQRGGIELTGPERAAEAILAGRAPDPATVAAEKFVAQLKAVLHGTYELKGLAAALLPRYGSGDSEQARASRATALERPGEGICVNCGRYCTGVRDDRRKGLRCYKVGLYAEPGGNCYDFFREHGVERPTDRAVGGVGES